MSQLRPSPMDGKKPTRADLAIVAGLDDVGVDDVLPLENFQQAPLKLLIVGINPGVWTAAVNAPFAHPGNRFWPSLFRAGITKYQVDATRGLTREDEAHLIDRGVGITNLVARTTVRADQLSREELRDGAEMLIQKVHRLQPQVVAIAGVTSFRVAFSLPRARLGLQPEGSVTGWPENIPLWVVPQPSGLNAHETIESLADKWRAVFDGL